jgi:hypothetical protein
VPEHEHEQEHENLGLRETFVLVLVLGGWYSVARRASVERPSYEHEHVHDHGEAVNGYRNGRTHP